MAKTKGDSKGAAAKAAPAVKNGRVQKASQTPVSKSKGSAKVAAGKAVEGGKKAKKLVKEPTPESESDSEADSESSISSSDESASEDDASAPVPAVNGKAKPAAKDADSDDSDESDDDSEAEAAALPTPKTNGAAKPAAADSSDEESDEESDDEATLAGAEAAADDSSDESDSESDEEAAPKPKANGVKTNGVAKKAAADDSDEDESDSDADSDASSDDSESDEEVAPAKSSKRKAEEPVTPAAKKTKVDASETEGVKNLFVGNISWNVDEEWLSREFAEYGEVTGCRIITDRETGRPKGFGYVEYTEASAAAAALEAWNGQELDGRALKVDFSTPRTPKENTPRERQQRYGDKVGNPSDTLWLGNLSFDVDNNSIQEVFEAYGTVTRVSLPTDRETGDFKGFGYVGFGSVDEAKAAFEAMSGQEILGRPVRLDYAPPKPDNGMGGGRGGGFRGGRGGGRGGFGDRGGRGGGRGGGFRGGRGAPRGGRGGSTNRGGFGDFKGSKISF